MEQLSSECVTLLKRIPLWEVIASRLMENLAQSLDEQDWVPLSSVLSSGPSLRASPSLLYALEFAVESSPPQEGRPSAVWGMALDLHLFPTRSLLLELPVLPQSPREGRFSAVSEMAPDLHLVLTHSQSPMSHLEYKEGGG